MLSFKDFIVVDYKPGEHELVKYAAHKRHRGRIGEETTDEALDFSQRRARARSMKKNKAKIAMGQRRAKNKPANQERLKKRAARHVWICLKNLLKTLLKMKSVLLGDRALRKD